MDFKRLPLGLQWLSHGDEFDSSWRFNLSTDVNDFMNDSRQARKKRLQGTVGKSINIFPAKILKSTWLFATETQGEGTTVKQLLHCLFHLFFSRKILSLSPYYSFYFFLITREQVNLKKCFQVVSKNFLIKASVICYTEMHCFMQRARRSSLTLSIGSATLSKMM